MLAAGQLIENRQSFCAINRCYLAGCSSVFSVSIVISPLPLLLPLLFPIVLMLLVRGSICCIVKVVNHCLFCSKKSLSGGRVICFCFFALTCQSSRNNLCKFQPFGFVAVSCQFLSFVVACVNQLGSGCGFRFFVNCGSEIAVFGY